LLAIPGAVGFKQVPMLLLGALDRPPRKRELEPDVAVGIEVQRPGDGERAFTVCRAIERLMKAPVELAPAADIALLVDRFGRLERRFARAMISRRGEGRRAADEIRLDERAQVV